MIESTFKLKARALTKKKAINKANELAHKEFKQFIKNRQCLCLQSAEMFIKSIKRRLFVFNIEYGIRAQEKQPVCVVTIKRKPTEKQIKKAPKKLYKKRDKKGRFTK